MPATPDPKNEIQIRFNELCALGGGKRGGLSRTKVQELLRNGGQRLNANGYKETEEHLHSYTQFNPWHVCFAIGLCWDTLRVSTLNSRGPW